MKSGHPDQESRHRQKRCFFITVSLAKDSFRIIIEKNFKEGKHNFMPRKRSPIFYPALLVIDMQ
ncbi:MAG: hypothetical protein PVJ81_06630, partial [Dehalococcoidia bacterium]